MKNHFLNETRKELNVLVRFLTRYIASSMQNCFGFEVFSRILNVEILNCRSKTHFSPPSQPSCDLIVRWLHFSKTLRTRRKSHHNPRLRMELFISRFGRIFAPHSGGAVGRGILEFSSRVRSDERADRTQKHENWKWKIRFHP